MGGLLRCSLPVLWLLSETVEEDSKSRFRFITLPPNSQMSPPRGFSNPSTHAQYFKGMLRAAIISRYDTQHVDELRLVHCKLSNTLPDQKLEGKKVRGWLGHGACYGKS